MKEIRRFISFGFSPQFSFSFSFGFRNIFLATFATTAAVYFLFQKHLLPEFLSKIVSKLLFYPTFPFTALIRLGNYWSPIDETITLGCAPMGFLKHSEELHKLGIRGVVNMCYEFSGPTSHYTELGIKQLRLPVIDHTEPSLEFMQEAVKFIQGFKERHQRVCLSNSNVYKTFKESFYV
jgi:hypothetical protein